MTQHLYLGIYPRPREMKTYFYMEKLSANV